MDRPHPRIAVVVLGMHRSGTSALTRSLSLAGLALPPDTGRVWESRTIIRLDERILARFGLEWHQPGRIGAERLLGSEFADLHGEALKALGGLFGPTGSFVVKEPRMARLVPFWDRVLRDFGAEPRYVLTLRSPADVASSLAARNAMHTVHGLTLWTDHIAAAERDTRGKLRVFSDYELLLRDRSNEIERLVSALDLPVPPLGAAERAAIDSFIVADDAPRPAPSELLATGIAMASASALYARLVGDMAGQEAVKSLVQNLAELTDIPQTEPLRGGIATKPAAATVLRTGATRAKKRKSRGNNQRAEPGGRIAALVFGVRRLFGFGRDSR